jgi:hypothetical protein
VSWNESAALIHVEAAAAEAKHEETVRIQANSRAAYIMSTIQVSTALRD